MCFSPKGGYFAEKSQTTIRVGYCLYVYERQFIIGLGKL